MASIISLLKLEELSLVDNPANPLAMAPLYKRHDPEGDNMADKQEDVQKKEKSPMDDNKIAEALEKLGRLEKENQLLRKALIENGFVIREETVEKKAEPEYIEIEGEKINKSDVPAAILKKMEADAKEKRELELVKKAKEVLPNVKEDHAKALVEKFEQDEEMVEFLRSVDALFAANMEEVGKKEVDADMTDPDEKLDVLVKQYMEDNKMAKKDYAKAYAAVAKTGEGKSLIAKSYKGDS